MFQLNHVNVASFLSLKIKSKILVNFVDLLQTNYTFLRADILSWETPAHAASNAENSAFLALLWPEI